MISYCTPKNLSALIQTIGRFLGCDSYNETLNVFVFIDPPPPSPDVAQNDLMVRLGYLLSDKGRASDPGQMSPMRHGNHGNQTEETFTSVSSLGSNEPTPERRIPTPDKGISDTSPLSTLTGKWPIIYICSVIKNLGV